MSHCISPRRRVLLAGAGGALLGCVVPAGARAYPERPIRIVSVACPGTSVDDYIRLLANFLAERLEQSVVVENRPGANMIPASDAVAKSAPDGYTLLVTASSAMSANPFLYRKLPYAPERDFVPVARMSTLPIAVVVSERSPYRSMRDLVDAARAKPGAIYGGSTSTGYRLMSAALNETAGINASDEPYKVMTGLLLDLVGGQVDYSMVDFGTAYTLVRARTLRALAVLSPKRVPLMPDVPTLAEAGILDEGLMETVSRTNWSGLFAPAGTPAAIVDRLSKLTLEFVNSPEAQKHYAARGSLPNPGTSAELRAAVMADQQVWRKMIAMAGIQSA